MNFQNRVLLVADNFSEIMEKFKDEMPYAILLIGEPIVWRQRAYTADGHCSIVDRTQPSIHYATKEDLENNKGTYWDAMPDDIDEYYYEYTAKIV